MKELSLSLVDDKYSVSVAINVRLYSNKYSAQKFTDTLFETKEEQFMRNTKACCLTQLSDRDEYKHDCYLVFNKEDITPGQIAHETTHLLFHMYKEGQDVHDNSTTIKFKSYNEGEEDYCGELQGIVDYIYKWWKEIE